VLFIVALPLSWGMTQVPPPEIKGYPDFNRKCKTDADCIFQPNANNSEASYPFKCFPDEGYCFCITGTLAEDRLMTPVSFEDGKCYGRIGAVCGIGNDGISLFCKDGLECRDDRCRDPKVVKTGEKNAFCHDDLDCVNGLACQEPRRKALINLKRCNERSSS